MTRTILALGIVTLGLLAFGAAAGNDADEPAAKGKVGYIKVEARGTLKTGIFAIGGETTGTVLTTADGALELDLAKKRDLQALAEKLDGKAVVVTGNLTIRKGVEVRQRLIVTVTGLKAAK
ncbi:MAG: hypothetical protein FJ271_07555 [Planctomycetes bacterium]|nr:hypothetical protein [Planctomycetota bacterium]